MWAEAEQLADALGPAAERQPDDLDPRHHHFRRGQIRELEEHLQHLPRFGPDGAEFLALLHDQLQLLWRVVLLGVLRLPIDADQPQHDVADPVQHDDQRQHDRLDPQHRRRDPQRHVLGLLQRQRLRDHLADDDVEVGEDGDGDDAGQAVRHDQRRRAGDAQQVIDAVRQDVLAIHAEAEAGDGDAELGGGDVAILERRVAQDLLDRLRQPVARAARASIAARGAPTIANSAATKMPLSRINPVMMRNAVTRHLRRGAGRAAAPAPTRPRRRRHRFDDDRDAVDRHVLARRRHAADRLRDERADGVAGTAPRRADHQRRLLEPHRARQPHAAVRQQQRPRVAPLNSSDTPPINSATTSSSVIIPSTWPSLADDERLVNPSIAHVREQMIGGDALVHALDRPQQRRHRRRRRPRAT